MQNSRNKRDIFAHVSGGDAAAAAQCSIEHRVGIFIPLAACSFVCISIQLCTYVVHLGEANHCCIAVRTYMLLLKLRGN